jgi:hypothetical protein
MTDEDGIVVPTVETLLRALKLAGELTGWRFVQDSNGGIVLDNPSAMFNRVWCVHSDGTAEKRMFFSGRVVREPVDL